MSLHEALQELIDENVRRANGVDTEWTTVTVRQLRKVLADHPLPTHEQVVNVLCDHDADSVIDCACGWLDAANDEDLIHHQAAVVSALFSTTSTKGETQ